MRAWCGMDDVAGLAHADSGDLGIGHACGRSYEHHHKHHSGHHGDSGSDGEDQGSSSSSDVAPAAADTGGNEAGNGGSGTFIGAMLDMDIAIFMPINIAIAGYGGTATATQTNWAYFNQGATQIAGIGGGGGNGNTASGGDILSLGGVLHGEALTGHNAAGGGGHGTFLGALIDSDVAIYAPINIAIAGYGGVATATQTNWAGFNQGATQIAGLGGSGGHGNTASGGDIAGGSSLHDAADLIFALLHPDSISAGHGAAGNGGNGIFAGFMSDMDHALFNPLNVADGSHGGSHVTAHQSNLSLFDQGALQIAGLGGHGGDLNALHGGDILMHLLDAHALT